MLPPHAMIAASGPVNCLGLADILRHQLGAVHPNNPIAWQIASFPKNSTHDPRDRRFSGPRVAKQDKIRLHEKPRVLVSESGYVNQALIFANSFLDWRKAY